MTHVADHDSILDSDPSNDVLEDFETYEAGETYRSAVWLIADSEYVNSAGGKVYLSQDPKATVQNPEHKTLTNTEYLDNGILIAYVYFTVAEPEVLQYLIGDVNNDGTVDVLDAALVQKYAAGKADLNKYQLFVADVNDDNNVDVLDAATIQKFAAGKITEFEKKF